jgi:hypothetical protein
VGWIGGFEARSELVGFDGEEDRRVSKQGPTRVATRMERVCGKTYVCGAASQRQRTLQCDVQTEIGDTKKERK